MIRFTETLKWDDIWFRSISGYHKLAFIYIIERCDNAGFWEVDLDAMQFHTKLSQQHCEGAIKGLERGLVGASGWVWVKNFLRHQKNFPLRADNPAHRQIIGIIERQSERFPEAQNLLPEGALKGLQSPIGIGKSKSNSTSKKKAQEKVAENTPTMNRIGGWFGRRPGTLWTIAEASALKAADPKDPEIEGMEIYYTASIPKDRIPGRRTDLITLLNNWSGELDRARKFFNDQAA